MSKKDIIRKPFIGAKDIATLLDIGESKALDIKKQLYKEITDKGYLMPRESVIPTKYLIERMMLDVTKI